MIAIEIVKTLHRQLALALEILEPLTPTLATWERSLGGPPAEHEAAEAAQEPVQRVEPTAGTPRGGRQWHIGAWRARSARARWQWKAPPAEADARGEASPTTPVGAGPPRCPQGCGHDHR
jgi:hypothetical protein